MCTISCVFASFFRYLDFVPSNFELCVESAVSMTLLFMKSYNFSSFFDFQIKLPFFLFQFAYSILFWSRCRAQKVLPVSRLCLRTLRIDRRTSTGDGQTGGAASSTGAGQTTCEISSDCVFQIADHLPIRIHQRNGDDGSPQWKHVKHIRCVRHFRFEHHSSIVVQR